LANDKDGFARYGVTRKLVDPAATKVCLIARREFVNITSPSWVSSNERAKNYRGETIRKSEDLSDARKNSDQEDKTTFAIPF
jgi:hypothetical protein